MSKKILVTGGSGLVGSHLLRNLVTHDHAVYALYRSEIPSIADAGKVNWIKGDILDIVLLEEAVATMDEVYHCAAMVSFNPGEKNIVMQTNVEGTANVVNASLSANVKKLCYVSSVAAFGKTKNSTEISEDVENSLKFDNNYGLSKYLAETEVWRAIGEGLQCVIVNPAIILGAADWSKGSAKIFHSAYQSFPWYAEGTTGFADVNDVVKAMILLMNSDISGERFIVSAENKSYEEIFTAIANAFATTPPRRKITPLLAGLVWRAESLKAMLTGVEPLVTKETAFSAFQKVFYDGSKLQKLIPSFSYTPILQTIQRVCDELKQRYNL